MAFMYIIEKKDRLSGINPWQIIITCTAQTFGAIIISKSKFEAFNNEAKLAHITASKDGHKNQFGRNYLRTGTYTSNENLSFTN